MILPVVLLDKGDLACDSNQKSRTAPQLALAFGTVTPTIHGECEDAAERLRNESEKEFARKVCNSVREGQQRGHVSGQL